MENIKTKDNIEEVLDIVTKEKQKELQEEIKPIPIEKEVKKAEDFKQPEINPYFQKDKEKKFNKMWIVLAVVGLVILLAQVVWSNYNISTDKLKGNTTIINENNMQAPSVNVESSTTNNNYSIQFSPTIENNLEIPKELSDALIKALNST